jgi:Co/Zn/Cd efflux system component
MGLVGAAMVARWSWSLIRDTARSLLDCEMDHPFAVQLAQAIRTDAPWSDHVDVLELRVWRVGGASFAVLLKLRSHVPWVGPAAVHRFLQRFGQLKTATVEIRQDGARTNSGAAVAVSEQAQQMPAATVPSPPPVQERAARPR